MIDFGAFSDELRKIASVDVKAWRPLARLAQGRAERGLKPLAGEAGEMLKTLKGGGLEVGAGGIHMPQAWQTRRPGIISQIQRTTKPGSPERAREIEGLKFWRD